MIECIEIMVENWIVRFLLEIGALFVLVAFVVIAALVLIADDQIKERSEANELPKVREKGTPSDNRHTDNPRKQR